MLTGTSGIFDPIYKRYSPQSTDMEFLKSTQLLALQCIACLSCIPMKELA